ncbi:MAG: response regulator [Deltaproteobacteria bacterium]|nr:response regulator [Deltaproteobacteria bacterium]
MTTQSPEKRVLVVNDNPVQRAMVGATLAKMGLGVDAAQHGGEALEKPPFSDAYDLVVTDLYMPTLDGWALCRKLRSSTRARLKDVPIIVLSSAFGGSEAERIVRDIGADAFLSFPYSPAICAPRSKNCCAPARPNDRAARSSFPRTSAAARKARANSNSAVSIRHGRLGVRRARRDRNGRAGSRAHGRDAAGRHRRAFHSHDRRARQTGHGSRPHLRSVDDARDEARAGGAGARRLRPRRAHRRGRAGAALGTGGQIRAPACGKRACWKWSAASTANCWTAFPACCCCSTRRASSPT